MASPLNALVRRVGNWLVPRGFRFSSSLVLIATASLALSTPSSGAQGDQDAKRIAGARILEAQARYQSDCAGCHGRSGEGVGGVIDFTSPAAVASLGREAMIGALQQKHDEALRSTWAAELTDERVEAVIDYVREAFMLPAPVADASLGRAIYAKSCSVCHGERGDGASWAKNSLNPPPRSFTGTASSAMTRQDMVRSVTFGRSGTAMMPFATQYDRDEIAAVVDYIRGTFMHESPSTEAAAVETHQATETAHHHAGGGEGHADVEADMTEALPSGLNGDIEKGRALYDGNCAECHGAKGDGQGRRAYFMRHKPENFTSAEARAELNRPHLFKAIAMGVRQTEMPAWSKVLDAQQIADVAEYVFSAFVAPSAPRPGEAQADRLGWQKADEDRSGAEHSGKKN